MDVTHNRKINDIKYCFDILDAIPDFVYKWKIDN